MSTLQPQTTLQGGKYKIIRTLGQGGFGITYLAEQVMLGRKVAIKEFFYKECCDREEGTSHVTLGTSSNRETVQRFMNKFLKEARTISQLDHPNIIKIHDIFEENNTAYYVMDYIEGENLSELVKRQGALPEATAVAYIKKVADALAYIHARSINHLDVKPGNIMLRRHDNQIVLIDFGLSKQYDDVGSPTSSTPIGISQGYAPIEQYSPSGVAQFSPQTDIYSLGATLYWLVVGKTPPSAHELINDGLPPMPLSVSASVQKVIRNAMQAKKVDRPQSVEAFLNLFEKKKSTLQSSPSPNHVEQNDEETRVLQTPSLRPDVLNGYHQKRFEDGSMYEGNFVNGRPEGKGTMIYVGGASYSGEWHNGLREGHGTWNYADGGSYVGEWHRGQMHGRGKLVKGDGTVILGIWNDGRMTSKLQEQKPFNTETKMPPSPDSRNSNGFLIAAVIVIGILGGIVIGVSQCQNSHEETPDYTAVVESEDDAAKKENPPISNPPELQKRDDSPAKLERLRKDALETFTGKFTIVAPGVMKEGITWAYDLELDPVNSNCKWVIDGCVNITHSKGFCGTFIKMEEAWEIYSFNLHNSLKYAIADMRRVDEFYEGENKVCKVKLELDEFNNIKMSYMEGNDAPYPLWDDNMNYTKVATFYRE